MRLRGALLAHIAILVLCCFTEAVSQGRTMQIQTRKPDLPALHAKNVTKLLNHRRQHFVVPEAMFQFNDAKITNEGASVPIYLDNPFKYHGSLELNRIKGHWLYRDMVVDGKRPAARVDVLTSKLQGILSKMGGELDLDLEIKGNPNLQVSRVQVFEIHSKKQNARVGLITLTTNPRRIDFEIAQVIPDVMGKAEIPPSMFTFDPLGKKIEAQLEVLKTKERKRAARGFDRLEKAAAERKNRIRIDSDRQRIAARKERRKRTRESQQRPGSEVTTPTSTTTNTPTTTTTLN